MNLAAWSVVGELPKNARPCYRRKCSSLLSANPRTEFRVGARHGLVRDHRARAPILRTLRKSVKDKKALLRRVRTLELSEHSLLWA
jgi:hypothetical protein